MVSILHISDPHFDTETMLRLGELARSRPECDVVALTGDCTSTGNKQLPASWNEWPQRLKLSVPGNHDLPHTFDLLQSWQCLRRWKYPRERPAPLVRRLGELIFVGVDTSNLSNPFSELRNDLSKVSRYVEGGSVIVLLTHQWPSPGEADGVAEVVGEFVGDKTLLVLHGHKHPWYSEGSEWESAARFGPLTYYRSKAISCKRPKRGRGHLIVWQGREFRFREVQAADPRYNQTGT